MKSYSKFLIISLIIMLTITPSFAGIDMQSEADDAIANPQYYLSCPRCEIGSLMERNDTVMNYDYYYGNHGSCREFIDGHYQYYYNDITELACNRCSYNIRRSTGPDYGWFCSRRIH